MHINPLVFSNKPKFRITRHVLFWTLWILYDTVFVALSWSKYPFARAFIPSFFVELFSFPLDMAFCYTIIYFLIPRFLYKGKYLEMIFLWIVLSLLYIICFRFYSTHIPPLLYTAFGMPYRMHSESFLWEFFELFSQINMEGCMAAAIKLGKMWYVKQQESEIFLSRERMQSSYYGEDNINRPQPAFLLRVLEKIENWSIEKSGAFPEIMHKIRELFSYVMYTNNRPKVSLDKELEMLKTYIELEGLGLDENIQINLVLPESATGKKITPLIILSLAENSFSQLSLLDTKNKSIDFKTTISESNFEMEISWSKPNDTSAMTRDCGIYMAKINKYLNLIYPNGNNLKIIIKPSRFVMQLKINLDRSVN